MHKPTWKEATPGKLWDLELLSDDDNPSRQHMPRITISLTHGQQDDTMRWFVICHALGLHNYHLNYADLTLDSAQRLASKKVLGMLNQAAHELKAVGG